MHLHLHYNLFCSISTLPEHLKFVDWQQVGALYKRQIFNVLVHLGDVSQHATDVIS